MQEKQSTDVWDVVRKTYKNIKFVGKGTYGIVAKAQHITTNETVAIKYINHINKHEHTSRLVFREISILRKLTKLKKRNIFTT